MKTFKILLSILAGLFLAYGCGSKSGGTGKVSDVDGNEYATVTIGSQVWMSENLRTTKYNDGTPIPNVTDTTWNSLKTGAYSWYSNDAASYKASFGALYNWPTVQTGKLCPTGWHVPSDKEWRILTDNQGGDMTAGIAMKAESGWGKTGNGTNASGFNAIPSGYRNNKGVFGAKGLNAYWWSSSPSGENAYYCVLFSGDATANKYIGRSQSGFSIRCIQNAGKK